jgi:hypothetical protein
MTTAFNQSLGFPRRRQFSLSYCLNIVGLILLIHLPIDLQTANSQETAGVSPQTPANISPIIKTFDPRSLPDKTMPPSPLSGMDVSTPVPHYYSKTVPANQIVTHKIDLKSVLNSYGVKHDCSRDAAFAAISKKLNMTPITSETPSDNIRARSAFCRHIGNDVYSIVAQQIFFNDLIGHLHEFEYGDSQIVVEVRFILVPEEDVATLQSFMIPNSFATFSNQLPQVKALATTGTFASSKNSELNQAGNSDASGTFVLASETRTRAFPTFIGRFNEIGVSQLMKFTKSRSSIELMHAPKVSLFPGSRGVITDGTLRPFVVSVKKKEVNGITNYQPIVQQVEDGTKLALQAEVIDGKIRLAGDLAFSKILSVATFDYPVLNAADGGQPTVQIPEHQVRKVHWSADVISGNSILIDSVEQIEKEIRPKSRFKKTVQTKTMRQVILITPTLVDNLQNESVAETTGALMQKR